MTTEQPLTARKPQPVRNGKGYNPKGYGSNGNGGPTGLEKPLGWFSIGLGLAELLAPRKVAKLAGTHNNTGWIRAAGVRELVCGIGILTHPRPKQWVWSRVGGDVLDLAALGKALGSRENDRGKTILSVAAVAGVTALDIVCAQNASAPEEPQRSWQATMIVNRSPEECYSHFRNLENLPRFVSRLKSVSDLGNGKFHAVAIAPGGYCVEWDGELIEDVPGQKIAWRSLPAAEKRFTGVVEFQAAPEGRGCYVHGTLALNGPARAIASLGWLIGKHPEQMMHKNLHRFKQLVEIGEVIETEGQPAGRAGSTTWLDSLARE